MHCFRTRLSGLSLDDDSFKCFVLCKGILDESIRDDDNVDDCWRLDVSFKGFLLFADSNGESGIAGMILDICNGSST